MTGDRAERFVVFNLRLLAASFAVVGILFIVAPDGVLDAISEVGDAIGDFPRAPETTEQLWLALGFAYMVVITGICLVVQMDVVRYRPLLLVLAAGKAASSLAALGFFLFDEDVFAYLLNFLVDGFLVGSALLLWSVAGRVGPATAPT
ncbi:MAG: hypothetical protein ACRDL3_08960 [Solirubrobacterales bacterium]